MLCQARVGVVPLQAIPKFLKNIPTKMFEYWACGLPVVASNLPPIRLFLREGEFGHLVEANDAGAFAGALMKLLSDPLWTETMGANARNAVRLRMNAKSEERRLLRLYQIILEPGKTNRTQRLGSTRELVVGEPGQAIACRCARSAL